MGWLYSSRWLQRKDLIEHLVNGNGVKTLKHCTVGNHLWCVHEGHNVNGTRVIFICLYLMRGPLPKNSKYTGADRDWWGYKDIDESMGPYHLTCPRSYLDMCTYPVNKHAYDWRQAVYRRHEHLAKMKIGARIKHGDAEFTIIQRRSPTSFRIQTPYGTVYRAGINMISESEVMT